MNNDIYEVMRMIQACKIRRDKAKQKGENWTLDHTHYCIHLENFYELMRFTMHPTCSNGLIIGMLPTNKK